MRLQPLGRKIIAARIPPTTGDLIVTDLPESREALVVSPGTRALFFTVGQRIMLPDEGVRELTINRRPYVMLDERDVPAIID